MIPMDDPEFFDKLILEGAMEFAGVDEEGEMLYSFTSKLEEVSPEMHQRVLGNVADEVNYLWSKGFLDMNVFEENPTVHITARALDREALEELPPYYRQLLELIKEASRR